jgi:hypothetical protein
MELKNKTDVFAPRSRTRTVLAVRHQGAVYPDFAGIGPIQKPEKVKQGRFAASRWSYDCINLAAPRFK